MIPRVSIGFPVRNAGPGVAGALEALLSQDFADFEVIISDNASTDQTPLVCDAFARMDRRIRVERQPRNLGLNRNFDHVSSRARGELFMWVAHDDRHDPSFIRRCVAALDAGLADRARLRYAVRTGTQREGGFATVDAVAGTWTAPVAADARYDLLGVLARATALTRRTIAAILCGVRPSTFAWFARDPERFLARLG